MRCRAILAVAVIVVVACKRGAPTPSAPDAATALATPVKTAAVARVSLPITLTAQGRTVAIEEQKIRAPYNAKIDSLRVTDGEHVRAGEVVATVVSQNSEAALEGARAMIESARTPTQRRDARRALRLARRGLVRAPLRATESGVVVAHSFETGALVTDREDILSIASADAIVFVAQVLQDELPEVHPGEPASIALAARPQPFVGHVHRILPTASVTEATAPVRIDFDAPRAPMAVGLFGTATITVGRHADATVVPRAALLRNDVSGETRVALVVDGHARWVTVKTGLERRDVVEILSPPLAAGQPVVVAGQVGLPDGAPVAVTR